MEWENEALSSAQRPDYRREIAEIASGRLSPKLMRDRLLDYHARDLAEALQDLTRENRNKLYSLLSPDILSDILEYADEDRAVYLNELGLKKRLSVLANMEPAEAAEYLSTLDPEERKTQLDLIEDEARAEIALVASFSEEEIGSKMSTNYIAVKENCGVRRAMSELIAQAAENDNVSKLYVTDEEGLFVGAIDLKDLIVARSDVPLDDITMTSYPYVYAGDRIEDCLERLRDYSEDSIPVLDADNKLCGVLTAGELAEMVAEEISEDYVKLGGLTEEEELKEPLIKSVGKRLPWLVVLFLLGLVVSGVVGLFENVAARLTVVVSFQSLILGMAGNVGTQSLAVTIRMLSNETMTGRDKLRLIAKEARIGFLNGAVLGLLSFLLVGLYLISQGETAILAFSVSFCTGASLLIAMLLSGLSGAAVPILLQKMKVDPAVASGPFITTLNDLVAVVTYYGLVLWLLLGVMGL